MRSNDCLGGAHADSADNGGGRDRLGAGWRPCLERAEIGTGLILGLVGTYGVVAQLVQRRHRELGIRIALGARAGQVRWLVLRHGVSLAATAADAVRGAAFVMSAVTASQAVPVAQACAPALRRGTWLPPPARRWPSRSAARW